MHELKFIGADSGFGDNNTSAYFTIDDKFILIDCGMTVFNKAKHLIKDYKELNIIITHLHNDHAGSLSQLIQYNYFVLGNKTKVISRCIHIKDYLDITGTPVESYELYTDQENITFIKTYHDKRLDSYGVLLNINNKKIIYTGDTNDIDSFLPYIDGINELYIDMSKGNEVHLGYNDCKDILDDIANKGVNIFFMHTDDLNYLKEASNNKYVIIKEELENASSSI
jgi:ribonuclease BN (tRNA processing enzyme)